MNTNVKKMITLSVLLAGSVSINYSYNYNKNIAHQNTTMQIKEISVNKTKTTTTNNAPKITEKPKTMSEDNNTKENLNNNLEKKQLSRGSDINNEFDIILTFYSGLADENGGFKDINCSGRKLAPGMVANNVIPQGTRIYTKEYGTLTVADKGGSNFDTIHRLDVYVPRNAGESDEEYKKRVINMGKVNVKGHIVK